MALIKKTHNWSMQLLSSHGVPCPKRSSCYTVPTLKVLRYISEEAKRRERTRTASQTVSSGEDRYAIPMSFLQENTSFRQLSWRSKHLCCLENAVVLNILSAFTKPNQYISMQLYLLFIKRDRYLSMYIYRERCRYVFASI